MKKLIFTFLAAITCLSSFAQVPTVSNGSFETWQNPSGLYQLEHPNNWYCNDAVLNNQLQLVFLAMGLPFDAQKLCYKSSDAYDGNYSAKIMTRDFGDTLNNLPAILTNAKQDLNMQALLAAMTGGNINPFELFAYTNSTPVYGRKIDSVTAFVKVPATNQDASAAFVLAYGEIMQDSFGVIGESMVSIPTSTTSWTQITLPVIYNMPNNNSTDSVVIGFISSADVNGGITGFHTENTLFVDKVTLYTSNATSIRNVAIKNLGFVAYPNPANTQITFKNNTNNAKHTLVVSNILGQVMHQQDFTNDLLLDLSKYAAGSYIYEIHDNKGSRQIGQFQKR